MVRGKTALAAFGASSFVPLRARNGGKRDLGEFRESERERENE